MSCFTMRLRLVCSSRPPCSCRRVTISSSTMSSTPIWQSTTKEGVRPLSCSRGCESSSALLHKALAGSEKHWCHRHPSPDAAPMAKGTAAIDVATTAAAVVSLLCRVSDNLVASRAARKAGNATVDAASTNSGLALVPVCTCCAESETAAVIDRCGPPNL